MATARRSTVSKTNTGTSSAIRVFPTPGYFVAGLGTKVTGTVSDYQIEHTYDDPDDGAATWHVHEFMKARSANDDGNYTTPIAGIRINIITGTGTVLLTVLQFG